MTLWIDADACPKVIREIVCRAAERLQHSTIFVANSFIRLPISPFVRFMQVADGADIADDYIADQCQEGDLVVTADIPLAVRIVERGALGIDPRGKLYDSSNIKAIASMRDFMHQLRSDGVETGGPKNFSKKDVQKFSQTLDKYCRI